MSATSTIAGRLPGPTPILGVGTLGLEMRGASRALRVPLSVKLIGANVGVVVGAMVVVLMLQRAGASSGTMMWSLAAAITAGIALNTTLTWIALRPIREIQATVSRIRRGDATVRISASPIADASIRNIGDVVNGLLDELDQDRVYMHRLTGDIIHAEDRERARISHELRESISQSLAAVTYQLAAVLHDVHDPVLVARLTEIRVLAGHVLEEIDVLSNSVHPRVLSDLGLLAGLRRLGTELTSAKVRIAVRIVEGTEARLRSISAYAEAGLYAIAESAVQNALRHGAASQIRVDVGTVEDVVTLLVVDDGHGFDVESAERRRAGMGLFKMHKRAAMICATLLIESRPHHGTQVCVTLPVGAATLTHH